VTAAKAKITKVRSEEQKKLLASGWPEVALRDECMPRIHALTKSGHDLSTLAWATAHGADGTTFDILVHAKNDMVSWYLLHTGEWEGDHLGAAEAFHLKQTGSKPTKQRYLDIGANLGTFSMLGASRGYEVTSFEAMEKNFLILRVSLCANPTLEERITLHNVGLSDKPAKCFIVSSDKNIGDGIIRCDIEKAEDFEKQEGAEIRGEVKLSTMNEMVKGDYFMMKIDIEGSEPLALSEKAAAEYFANNKIRGGQLKSEKIRVLPTTQQCAFKQMRRSGRSPACPVRFAAKGLALPPSTPQRRLPKALYIRYRCYGSRYLVASLALVGHHTFGTK